MTEPEIRSRKKRIRALLRVAVSEPYKTLVDKDFWQEDVFRAFCDWCDDTALDSSDKAIEHAFIAQRLSEKIGDRHLICKAMGLYGSAHRIESRPNDAERIIEDAFELADPCPCCLADLYRRYAGLLQRKADFENGLRYLDLALECFNAIGDLDGVGRVELNRGVSLKHLGRDREALECEARALRLLSPESPQIYHLAALTNMAYILATADDELFEQAKDYMKQFRERLKDVDGFTIVRVYVSWIDGLILARLGERKAALQKLRKVRKALIRHRLDRDAVAVTADITALYCETSKYRFIVTEVQDTLDKLGEACGLRSFLEKLLHLARREVEQTREIAFKLREAAKAKVPCLLDPAPQPSFASP